MNARGIVHTDTRMVYKSRAYYTHRKCTMPTANLTPVDDNGYVNIILTPANAAGIVLPANERRYVNFVITSAAMRAVQLASAKLQ